MPAAHVTLAGVVAAAAPDATGALWRLEGAARQLDANVIRLRPGARGEPHVEPDLDVLLVVAEGRGTLHRAGADEELAPGSLVFVPRGEQRAVSAGDAGLVYLTAHRRRPGMTIRRVPTTVTAEGGEAPCLLPRVCEDCGRVTEDGEARYCGRCGKRLPGQA
ncbi:cupin domain-containing protein [Streptomyces sp. SID8379]|uniref:cupin domain-containing protein n=1 Tax=unclassified Streptomyces TaxID=2593676 RepID=UPI00036D0113|nr:MULTISPECIES: cupin domain-containing protein [unclassified Streptomyces]MYW70004.1 cupin domain-containing protein [Streptomyces sp. SID8379]